ncbi:hypothetical protein LJC68_01775 [Bacteroidales bacterium OttesenSCG-928-B11]|nr:hypothetical protein [Bacteroidales bacterium OttesenSCG-928-C03]MDL2311592.1 hypothetical protein [Bacteroidales bacterium OttesenSCG-928-B11]
MYLNSTLFEEFLAEREITWAGVDFSKARFTKNGFDFSTEILQQYLLEWNKLIISDQKKYDIRMAFRKPMMQYDLALVSKKNKTVKAPHAIVNHLTLKNQFSEEDMIKYASSLDIPQHTKFVLSVVVESFDQDSKTASLWVLLLNSESREVVLCEKFLKTPAGFGTKNYWARVFYNLFFDIRKSCFLRWMNLVKQ